MFWPTVQNLSAIDDHCKKAFGVKPRRNWIWNEFAGTAGATNIVFSNGQFDPWRSGGVTSSKNKSGVLAVTIAEGAHHLDLMFSNPADPESVTAVRALEMKYVEEWLGQTEARR